MPKSKNNPHQSSFFRREIPQMPDGYYSSGPNPNLRRFVEEHAKPYDPATDDYHVPPFDKPITTTKATAIYNMHTYWSKKPHDAIREYIKHYTNPGDLVLDPFCGSGGTALAAMIDGRAAIAIDLSPAATFITRYYTDPIDEYEADLALAAVLEKIKPIRNNLYHTICPKCNGKAEIKYAVHSEVFQCLKCLESSPLSSWKPGRIRRFRGKDVPILLCPNCDEEINTQTFPRKGSKLVEVCLECQEGCKPKLSYRNLDNGTLSETDANSYKRNAGRELPNDYFDKKHYFRRIIEPRLEKNIAKAGAIGGPSSLYTPRNITSLLALRDGIDTISAREPVKAFLRGVLNSISLISSRMCDADNTQISKGTYYIPHIYKELNVFQSFERRYKVGLIGKLEIAESIENPQCLISTQDSEDIKVFPENSIDYIFTDPPYGGTIQYAALNAVWEYILGFEPGWQKNEVVVSEHRNITQQDWQNKLKAIMAECYKLLKPGRWATICFHGSEVLWADFQDLMAEVGFLTDRTDNVLSIEASQKSYNQQTAEKVYKKDLVINYRKPRTDEFTISTILTSNEDTATFTEKVRLILVGALDTHPGSTSDRLYDELVSRMVRRGEFERHNFDELLRSVAEEVNDRWYLLETAGLVDETESKKETAAAKRLEGYMQKFLSEQRDAMGVHYSDLFEQYLPIKDKPRRLLQDWLPEFFYKTPDGTWRPPTNEEERQQKAALRSSGALRRIKRFANALIDGVPPADRDKPENAVTLADWIRQCRRAGLFELGRALYEKGGLRFEELNEEMRLLVEEDYQISVGRSEKQVTKRKAKGQQLSLMEE